MYFSAPIISHYDLWPFEKNEKKNHINVQSPYAGLCNQLASPADVLNPFSGLVISSV